MAHLSRFFHLYVILLKFLLQLQKEVDLNVPNNISKDAKTGKKIKIFLPVNYLPYSCIKQPSKISKIITNKSLKSAYFVLCGDPLPLSPFSVKNLTDQKLTFFTLISPPKTFLEVHTPNFADPPCLTSQKEFFGGVPKNIS